ncbi:N-terminal domain of NEFA-interacting nuclear protein NIP30-domain-containing protein [Phaeosphaeriaceae sp. PMI808]|nr:N-terminal domain of NEFA-interacting nuclear protein NIP30-domain-containing protein [Phaeosphaeriaceae sp. PMI808]
MSSGFVSGGTVENPTERDDEWRKAQAELEATRIAKADLRAQHNGKSLFEILQENKDKKQADFEEKARYKLHVALNDDAADYLNSIEEKKRKEEAHVRNDTREQLEVFRRQQEEAEKKALEDSDTDAQSKNGIQWVAPGRKRKNKTDTSLLAGVKLKRSNLTFSQEPSRASQPEKDAQVSTGKVLPTATANNRTTTKSVHPAIALSKVTSKTPAAGLTNPISLGLGYALSDDED